MEMTLRYSSSPYFAVPAYCVSVTFSIHSTTLPFACSCTARCDMAVVGEAPCQ